MKIVSRTIDHFSMNFCWSQFSLWKFLWNICRIPYFYRPSKIGYPKFNEN